MAEFKRDLSAGEQTPDTLIRSAQLRGTLKRSHRHRESPTPPRPCRCFLELARNVLVDAADQRGPVPDSPIRVLPQHFSQRLVNASALRQANLLTNSRTDQRMAESHFIARDHGDRSTDRRLEHLDTDSVS